MAARKKIRRAEAQLGFDALFIEGGLLSPEWLTRVAQLSAGSQTEADYRIEKGLNLRDEIGRYWRIAQAYWRDFAVGRTRSTDLRGVAESFVSALLRKSFEFESLHTVAPLTLGDRVFPIGHAALDGRVPVVIAPAGMGLDKLPESAGEGGRRRSAFGLAQEYLNAQEGALWGIVSDGCTLRILRDNASLTRPAWIESDLERIFTEERYADFAALWLLLHETRFGKPGQPVTDCALETWRNAGREEGTRAREFLRRGVGEALLALGQGFLAHPSNQALRSALQDGSLSTRELFQQLLRLVYRLIFLLTVEERGLLHPEGVSEATRKLYEEGYSLRQLRERSARRSAHDRFSDRWEALKIVFRALAVGEPHLGLPALAGLFAPRQCTALDAARLENRALLLAMFRLSWLRNESGLARVNWRDMGPEELGSVYESLLELVPQITDQGRRFAFATGGETKGNARKTTGSYYTPDSLVQVLLDSALEPVVADTLAANPGDPVEALLSLSVVDPACGSGHFLLGAARRLAVHVARLRANGTPSASQYRVALRDVVRRCIYGVDLNPMALELCKVSLWMEALEPGLPLTFLDSHIQQGNSLLGTTRELMEKGIPDAAWEPVEGDDKKAASALKKRNKAAAKVAYSLFKNDTSEDESRALMQASTDADAADDTSAKALEEKERKWKEGFLGLLAYRHQKFVADAWCAAFVWPKQSGGFSSAAPTDEIWRQLRDNHGNPSVLLEKTVRELAAQFQFFHWHLQFPQVFAKGGFDVVLGNPPWESLRFNEEEFFAGLRPDIAQASTAADRKKLIAKLASDDVSLFAAYHTTLRVVGGTNAFVRSSARFPLCGVGRVNLFALFAEAARSLVSKRGRVGQILPSGIVSDDSTKLFFQDVVERRQLVSFFDFENRDGIFGDVHRSFKFGIFTLAGTRAPNTESEFVFFATCVGDLKDAERRFTLSSAEIALLNPDTRTCPIFRCRRDAELTKAIYRLVPALCQSSWDVTHQRLINQSDDSDKFASEPGENLLPLYEGKCFHLYDHRWVTTESFEDRSLSELEYADPHCTIQPRYWYPLEDAQTRLGGRWGHLWVIAWRDIARSTDERTLISAVLPSVAVPNTARVILIGGQQLRSLTGLLANLGTYVLDFIARQKVGGTHVSGFIVDQLTLLPPETYDNPAPWTSEALAAWLMGRVLELTYTAWDLEPFARAIGHAGTPLRWDQERRFHLRCELDAAFFHLYGLSREDIDYIMDTFPIVRKNDEKVYGEYRTKRVILAIYDALTKAAQTGKPYCTPLDPLPAAPGASHGVFTPDGTPKDYAEALRTGLLFTVIRQSGDEGVSQGILSRALLWLLDSKYAASWLEGPALADFERVRSSDPLLTQGAADSQVQKLLAALEDTKAITRDAAGIVRLRAGSSIPKWLPQTPTLTKLASVMCAGLERAEAGDSTTPAIEKPNGEARQA